MKKRTSTHMDKPLNRLSKPIVWALLLGFIFVAGTANSQTNDLRLDSITVPKVFGCDYLDPTFVTIKIRNVGTQAQSNFTVGYRIFAVSPPGSSQTVSQTIGPGQTLYYTFPISVDISYPSMYSFTAWVSNPGDNNPSNDTIKGHPVIVVNPVRQLPFIEPFDIGLGGVGAKMYNDPLWDTDDWLYGASAQGIPNDNSGNGYFAYINNLTPHNRIAHLNTPCIDLTGAINPHLEFYLNNSSSNIQLFIDVYSNGVWHSNIASFQNQNVQQWVFKEVSLSQFSNRVIKVRFRGHEASTSTPDMGIDDIKVYDLPPVNLALVKIESPRSGCDLLDIEPIIVKALQLGYDKIYPNDYMEWSFQINNGPIYTQQTQATQIYNRGDTITHIIDTPGNFTQTGEYVLKVWGFHPLDTDKSNDTITVVIDHVPTIRDFPYKEDFRFGRGGWISGGINNTWEFGPPGGQVISVASRGANAWGTGRLQGSYNNNEQSYVESPCFDFSTMVRPQLSMDVWWDVQSNFDGAAVMFSVDNGQSWVRLGNAGDPLNWYNHANLPGQPGGQQQGWTGSATAGSQFWVPAKLNMPNLAGMPQARFRVVFGTNATINNFDGFAFDNIAVGEAPISGLPDTVRACGYIFLDPGLDPKGKFFWSTGARTPTLVIHNNQSSTMNQKITLYYENESGLYAADTVVIELQPGPYVNLGPDTVICDQPQYVLDAGNPGLQYLWDNNSTNRLRTVTADGTYKVTVFSSNPVVCVKSDSVTVLFRKNPVANFTVSQPDSSIHHYVMVNNSSNATDYYWDFGDSIYSMQANPEHFYPHKNLYHVRLIASNECGSDTATATIDVDRGLGVNDPLGLSRAISVFPNPSNGNFTVAWNNPATPKAELRLVDATGRVVWQEVVYPTHAQTWQQTFSVHAAAGIYRLLVYTESGVGVKEVVITR